MRLILAAVCALALAGCNQPVVEAPDQIFHGGTIYTGLTDAAGAARHADRQATP